MYQQFLRDTWAEIDLDAIEKNVANIRQHLDIKTQIMAVVKADGYGHGAKQVAEVALSSGATWLGVALLDEAIALRLDGINAPILVLGYVRPEDVELAATHHISIMFYQADWLKKVISYYKSPHPLFLHLKMDTGMGRLGIRDQGELENIVDVLKTDSRLKVEGAFTHFATADEEDNSYFQLQYDRFNDMLQWLENQDIHPNIIHCGNSAASLKYPSDMFNLIRYGIAMYGLAPSPSMKNSLPFQLKEAFSLHSRLTHVKEINAGEAVSYGATYQAKGKEWIGTIPIGYADGWLRALAKNSHVLIVGKRYPVIGKICMDQCMCHIEKGIEIGERVTLIGSQDDEYISIDEIASRLKTINYEIPCMISQRVPRIYLRNGNKMELNNPLLSRFTNK